MIEISIIVPVYNAQNYIERCLRSILHQTFNNFEVILIDDCSTDDCIELAHHIIGSDERFIVFRNECNIGQGLCKNLGVNMAKGRYVGFVDSDDSVEPEMYEHLYNEISKKDLDVIGCNFQYVHDNGYKVTNLIDMNRFRAEKMDYLINSIIFPTPNGFLPHAMWNKLYNRKFLMDNNVMVRSERELFLEDMVFNFEVFNLTEKVSWLDTVYYNYIVRSGSTMYQYQKHFLRRFLESYSIMKAHQNIAAGCRSKLIEKNLFIHTFAIFFNAFKAKSFNLIYKDLISLISNQTVIHNFKSFNYSDIPTWAKRPSKILLTFLLFFYLRFVRKI